MATIAKFHGTFIAAGLALRFESIGRPPQSHYPAYRDLLVATDALGRKGNFLASEDGFQFVKSLQGRDLVVPVVGNLAGPTALAAIGTSSSAAGNRCRRSTRQTSSSISPVRERWTGFSTTCRGYLTSAAP